MKISFCIGCVYFWYDFVFCLYIYILYLFDRGKIRALNVHKRVNKHEIEYCGKPNEKPKFALVQNNWKALHCTLLIEAQKKTILTQYISTIKCYIASGWRVVNCWQQPIFFFKRFMMISAKFISSQRKVADCRANINDNHYIAMHERINMFKLKACHTIPNRIHLLSYQNTIIFISQIFYIEK